MQTHKTKVNTFSTPAEFLSLQEPRRVIPSTIKDNRFVKDLTGAVCMICRFAPLSFLFFIRLKQHIFKFGYLEHALQFCCYFPKRSVFQRFSFGNLSISPGDWANSRGMQHQNQEHIWAKAVCTGNNCPHPGAQANC